MNILHGTLIQKINSSFTNWRSPPISVLTSSQVLYELHRRREIFPWWSSKIYKKKGSIRKKINQNCFKGTSLERWGRKGTFAKSLKKSGIKQGGRCSSQVAAHVNESVWGKVSHRAHAALSMTTVKRAGSLSLGGGAIKATTLHHQGLQQGQRDLDVLIQLLTYCCLWLCGWGIPGIFGNCPCLCEDALPFCANKENPKI